jgi:hypothetical protein
VAGQYRAPRADAGGTDCPKIDDGSDLVVQRKVALPIAGVARSIVPSRQIDRVNRISLDFDGQIVDTADVDILLVDEREHWVAAPQIKRCGNLTKARKRPV